MNFLFLIQAIQNRKERYISYENNKKKYTICFINLHHKLELKISREIGEKKAMELFREIAEKKAIVTIGKNLLSEQIIEQILNLIKKKEIIKIKILKSVGDNREQIITEILNKTKLNLLDIRGNSFIVSRKPVTGLKISLKCRELINNAQTLK